MSTMPSRISRSGFVLRYSTISTSSPSSLATARALPEEFQFGLW
jgi:hypothetical protein